ncbi:MAG TPA: CHAD domain-containing protein [Methanosarcina sp.]|nr:CHAD domain-containing protein [Methanosarcina sp.]
MEIESKFLVLDKAEIKNLETLSQLGDYSLSEAAVQLIEDTFLDTKKTALMAEGYFLRLRKEMGKEGQWLTIKSLGGLEDGVHTREEYVSFLPEEVSVFDCPDARIRDTILELSSGFDLLPLMKIKQKRIVRQVKLGERHTAEISLDHVSLKSGKKEKLYSELEIELKTEGTRQDLQAIAEYLLGNYHLVKDPLSKFERALLFKENLSEKTLLSFRERAFCMQLADQENIYGKQAKILLSLEKYLNAAEVSLLLKVPEQELEAFYSRFEKERLFSFPFTSKNNESREFHFHAGRYNLDKSQENIGFKEWTLETLFDLYETDEAKAENIRNNALILFDGLFPYHRLGQQERKILGLAALLQNIGSSVFPEEKSKIGKEILLTHPLKGLKLHELRMLALIMELQSPEISVKNLSSVFEESNIALPPEIKNKALILTSFIRIADLLKNGNLRLLPDRIRQVEGAVEVEIIGRDAEKAVKRAEKRRELWEYLFGTKLLFIPRKEMYEAEIIEKKAEEIKGENEKKEETKKENEDLKFVVRPENSMAVVAQRVFSKQFARMLAHEKGTRKGKSIEDLHDMRVAIRRMRAAAKVFEAYLDSKKLEPHLKGLKSTLAALSDVRDLDVFREKAEEYLKKLPPEKEHDLDPLFTVLAKERKKARKNMTIYLKSERYTNFKKDFSESLDISESWALPTTTTKHDALPYRVMDVLPSILYARFADISAYSEWIEGPYVSIERLHRLRIASKGLRYTLEFFGDVLGKEAEIMIKEITALQDHLGDLHDAVVAIDLLGSYLQTGDWGLSGGRKYSGEKKIPEGLKEVEAYKIYREEELQILLDTFHETWAKVQSDEFRQRIENAIKNLYQETTSL